MTYARNIILSAALFAALASASAALPTKPAKAVLLKPTLVASSKLGATPSGSTPMAAVPVVVAPVPVTLTVSPTPEGYTGILIDARHLSTIDRSPAPAIYGPGPDMSLLYPNRSDVPTPDEVQDESIVRYYHTEADAEAGVGGSHPLILTALAVLGPAHDALQLSADDMVRLQDAEKSLHFVETWKVGFLIPAGQ